MGTVETRPVYPSSLIVHTNSGYQRARDFRTDSKYTEDTFDHIPQPGTPKNPGSSGSASSFSGTGYSATQDTAIAQMVTDLLRLSSYGSRPHHVLMGMVETHPVYPSSLIVHTNSGYRRARDFRTDSKYTEDTFDHVP
ncbi:hypothetical protein GOODEAATRI_019653 [Goodea atripinnis]|uniref:Uncharacterized protein n=1 Tax=Goodea atripinnis TaxID=208336 RepID=A0ABV0NW12_9TELE